MNQSTLAIDCRLRGSTGIGRYIREVVPRVITAFPDRRFLLIGPDNNDPWAGNLVNDQVQCLPTQARVFRQSEQRLFRQVWSQTNVLWCPHFCVPWRVPSEKRLVTTIHDLIPWHVAVGWKGRLRQIGAWFYLRAARRNSSRVLTVSAAVKAELVREFSFSAGRIHVTHNGVGHDWFSAANEKAPSQLLGQRYVIYLGNLSPHKNVEGLLAAFREIAERVPQRLAIVGEWKGFTGHANLRRDLAALGDRVIFTSRLTEPELHGAVTAAELLIQPSREEGFGLPPLEAMAAGTPVLASDCAALLETTAQGAHRFSLRQPNDLARQMHRLLTDDNLRRTKIDEGKDWAARFTWDRTAELTAEALRQVMGKLSGRPNGEE